MLCADKMVEVLVIKVEISKVIKLKILRVEVKGRVKNLYACFFIANFNKIIESL